MIIEAAGRPMALLLGVLLAATVTGAGTSSTALPAASDELAPAPALISPSLLALRLAFRRAELSARHLRQAEAEGGGGGDASLAWRHLEA
eukprot:COSAG06_NODE_29850_length_549_cov_1.171111_2_plen_89_part_01